MNLHPIDFSKYDDTSLNVYNIGWLGKSSDHDINYSNLSLIDKLKCLLKRERVNLTRGITLCSLCSKGENRIRVDIDGDSLLLGISEVWIPNGVQNKIFAAPDLIIHFIEKHNYRPPQEFIEAIESFDLTSAWSGEEAYNKYLKAKYG